MMASFLLAMTVLSHSFSSHLFPIIVMSRDLVELFSSSFSSPIQDSPFQLLSSLAPIAEQSFSINAFLSPIIYFYQSLVLKSFISENPHNFIVSVTFPLSPSFYPSISFSFLPVLPTKFFTTLNSSLAP